MAEQVAVVIGGASGIGAACAPAFSTAGFRVVVADLTEAADVGCDVTAEDQVAGLAMLPDAESSLLMSSNDDSAQRQRSTR